MVSRGYTEDYFFFFKVLLLYPGKPFCCFKIMQISYLKSNSVSIKAKQYPCNHCNLKHRSRNEISKYFLQKNVLFLQCFKVQELLLKYFEGRASVEVSWGAGCEQNLPTVLTDVPKYRRIQKHLCVSLSALGAM